MQENYENEFEAENFPPLEDAPSLVDRMVGIFTSPATLFEKMSAHPPKVIDWLIPVLIAAVITVLSTFLQMNDPEIVEQMYETQVEKMESKYEKSVENNEMTEAEASEKMAEFDEYFTPEVIQYWAYLSIITVPLALLVKLLLGGLLYFLIARFALKGLGDFSHALTVYGTAHYIVALQALVMLVITLVTGTSSTGTSITAIGGFDSTTLVGFILSKADIFSILIVYTVGVGLSKMYRAESSGKYIAAVFALWFGGTLAMFLLGNFSPFFYDLAAGL